MSVEIVRNGNLLEISGPDHVESLLRPALSYDHKAHFHGVELRQRQQLKRENPTLRMNPHFEVTKRVLYSTSPTGKLLCCAGLLKKIELTLKNFEVDFDFKDTRKSKLPPAKFEALLDIEGLEFRYKQDEAIAAIDTYPGGVIVAPTGFGKSFIATMLCKIYPTSRIAFIAPGIGLINSLYKRLNDAVPDQVGRIGGGKHEPQKRVILCSADSLHKLPLDQMHLIIYDEVHTAATEKRSKLLCAKHTDAKFIGFTASANCRADGADSIIEAIFGPILLRVNYDAAVQHSVVSPIKTVIVPVPANISSPTLSGDSWLKKSQGYWNNAQRNSVIASATQHAMSAHLNEDPQTLVMVETVEHAFRLKQLLPDFTLVYSKFDDKLRNKLIRQGVVDEATPTITKDDRERMLTQFEAGKLKRVISTHCWKQGIDPVHLRIFVRADGGTSEINNIQLPGRLSRLHEDKDSGWLLDFGDEFDPWAKSRADKRAKAYSKNGFSIQHSF